MDTCSFIVHVKAEDIAEDIESRFEISSYEIDRPQPMGKMEK